MRVQFDLTEEAVSYLDEIKRKTGTVSRAEVLRNAIAGMRWLVEKAEDGRTILAVKEGSEIAVELSMPILQDAAIRAAASRQSRNGEGDSASDRTGDGSEDAGWQAAVKKS